MTRARDIADLAGAADAGTVVGKSVIINGDMAVWQRGTSQTTSGDYGADRFWMSNATSAARSTDAPSGFVYSTKLTYNASDMSIGQPIELPVTGEQGQLVSGQTVTLSYYAKVDLGTEGIATAINFRDSKFSATNQVSFTPTITNGQNATWTTTWTRYTHTFTIPTVASTNVLAGLEIGGISKTAYITGVKLEVGDTATDFLHESYGENLRKCQRYYETGDHANSIFWSGATQSGAYFYINVPYKVDKRALPTVTPAYESTNTNFPNTAPSVSSAPLHYFLVAHTANATGGSGFYRANWTSDAEL